MMKFTLFFALVYQIAQIAQGFVTLSGINNLIWTPPGCVACYQIEGNNYFQNLNKLRPHCADREINDYNGVQSKIFLHHICEYQTGTGFSDKYKALQKYGNLILQKFQKCFSKKLRLPEKRKLEDFTFAFENARKRCENEKFLEKGLKGMRQVYFEPQSLHLQNHKRIRKQKRPSTVDQSKIMQVFSTPIENKSKMSYVAPIAPIQHLEDEFEEQSTLPVDGTSGVDEAQNEKIILDDDTLAENVDSTFTEHSTEEQLEDQSILPTDDKLVDQIEKQKVNLENDPTPVENADSTPLETTEEMLADQVAPLTADTLKEQTQDEEVALDNSTLDENAAHTSGDQAQDEEVTLNQVEEQKVNLENDPTPVENADSTPLETTEEMLADQVAPPTADTLEEQTQDEEVALDNSTLNENAAHTSGDQAQDEEVTLNQVEEQKVNLENDPTPVENADSTPLETTQEMLVDQVASLATDTSGDQAKDEEVTLNQVAEQKVNLENDLTLVENADSTPLETTEEMLVDKVASPAIDTSGDQAKDEEVTLNQVKEQKVNLENDPTLVENADSTPLEMTEEMLVDQVASPSIDTSGDRAKDEEVTLNQVEEQKVNLENDPTLVENANSTPLETTEEMLVDQVASPTADTLGNQAQDEEVDLSNSTLDENVDNTPTQDSIEKLEDQSVLLIDNMSESPAQDEITSNNTSTPIKNVDTNIAKDSIGGLEDQSASHIEDMLGDQTLDEKITSDDIEDSSASSIDSISEGQVENEEISSINASTPNENIGELDYQSALVTNDIAKEQVHNKEITPVENVEAKQTDDTFIVNDLNKEEMVSNSLVENENPTFSEPLEEKLEQPTSLKDDESANQIKDQEISLDNDATLTENIDSLPTEASQKVLDDQSELQTFDTMHSQIPDEEITTPSTNVGIAPTENSTEKLEDQSLPPTNDILEDPAQNKEIAISNSSASIEEVDPASLEKADEKIEDQSELPTQQNKTLIDQVQDKSVTVDHESVPSDDAGIGVLEDAKEKLNKSLLSGTDINTSLDPVENEEIIPESVSKLLEASEEKLEDESASLTTNTSTDKSQDEKKTSNNVFPAIKVDDPIILEHSAETSDQSVSDTSIDSANDVKLTSDATITPVDDINATPNNSGENIKEQPSTSTKDLKEKFDQLVSQTDDNLEDQVQNKEVASDNFSISTTEDISEPQIIEASTESDSTLSTNESLKQNVVENNDALVPLEETLISASVDNTETNLPKSPNEDEPSLNLSQIQDYGTSISSPDTSSNDDFWAKESLEMTPESQSVSNDDTQTKNPLNSSQENDSKSEDELLAPSNTNISTEKSVEMKSEENTALQTADSKSKNSNKIEEDSLITKDDVLPSLPKVDIEDESIPPNTNTLSDEHTPESPRNDDLPDTLPEIQEESVTPKITETELTNSLPSQFELKNSDGTLTSDSITPSPNPSSLEPIDLVERISTSKDDMNENEQPSSNVEKNENGTNDDTIDNPLNNNPLENVSEADNVDSFPKDGLKDNQEDLVNGTENSADVLETDTPITDMSQNTDKDLSDTQKIDHDETISSPPPPSQNSDEASNLVSDKSKDQTSTILSDNHPPTINSIENQVNLQDDVSLEDKSNSKQTTLSKTSSNESSMDHEKTNKTEDMHQNQSNITQDAIEGGKDKLNDGYLVDHNTIEKLIESQNEEDAHLGVENKNDPLDMINTYIW